MITKVLISKKRKEEMSQRRKCDEDAGFENGRVPLANSVREEEASRSWNIQGNRFSPRTSKRNTALPTP